MVYLGALVAPRALALPRAKRQNGGHLRSVAEVGPGELLAVGDGGIVVNGTVENLNQSEASELGGADLRAVASFGGSIIAIAAMADGSNSVWSSADGAAWTRLSGALPEGLYLLDLVSVRGRLVAVGAKRDPESGEPAGGVVLLSQDAVTWRPLPAEQLAAFDLSEGVVASVAASENRAVAVGHGVNGSAVWASTDGANWIRTATSDDAAFADAAVTAVGTTNRQFLAVGSRVYDALPLGWNSPDGSRWTRRELALGEGAVVHDLAGTSSGYVLVGGVIGEGPAIWSSTDGQSWTRNL